MKHIATLGIFTMLSLPLLGLFSTMLIVQAFGITYAFAARFVFKRTRIGRRLVARLDNLCSKL